MTQIFVHRSSAGIVLATDSNAVTFTAEGEARYIKVQKVFDLSPHVVIASGGAGYGVALCRSFRDYVKRLGLVDAEEIMHRALPFLRSEIQRIHHEQPFEPLQPDLDRLYIVLAGHILKPSEEPFRFLLLGSEHASDPLHPISTGHAVAVPRHLGMEYRLGRHEASKAALEEVEKTCQNLLTRLAEQSQDVGPPFHFIRITSEGIKVRTQSPADSAA